jgi:predicted ABC-type ATPase
MERPKLLIIAGPNGAGKTTVTSQILKHEWVEGCEYINPDRNPTSNARWTRCANS